MRKMFNEILNFMFMFGWALSFDYTEVHSIFGIEFSILTMWECFIGCCLWGQSCCGDWICSKVINGTVMCNDFCVFSFPTRNRLQSTKWHKTARTSWWRHQMDTFSALLAICAGNSPVPGEFPAQRPVTRSFDVFVHLRLNKRLSKQS